MSVLGLLGDALSYFGIQGIPGWLGLKALSLSEVRLGPWGFNPSIPTITAQLSALGLWFGALGGSAYYALHALKVGFPLPPSDKIMVLVPLLSTLVILFIGLVNAVT